MVKKINSILFIFFAHSALCVDAPTDVNQQPTRAPLRPGSILPSTAAAETRDALSSSQVPINQKTSAPAAALPNDQDIQSPKTQPPAEALDSAPADNNQVAATPAVPSNEQIITASAAVSNEQISDSSKIITPSGTALANKQTLGTPKGIKTPTTARAAETPESLIPSELQNNRLSRESARSTPQRTRQTPEPFEPLELHSLQKKRPGDEDLIQFSFEKKPLVDIIDELAAKKAINIILPQGAAELETIKKQTVTFQPQGREKIPVQEAWNLLSTFLELSGFALSKKKDDLYSVARVGKPDEAGINREILPLFVNVPYTDLPDSEERIRYIYYLRNLKTPTAEDRETNPIARIFKDMLSPGAPVVYEPKSNGFIITDKANVIAAAMRIISELDHSGFKETIEVIHVNNIPVRDVVKVFDSLKKAAGDIEKQPSPFIRGDIRSESLTYFAADTRIVADERQNNLILMGRQTAVERIAEFVEYSMDKPPESGLSILHSYDLQYLDAKPFADVLSKIVAAPVSVGGQATVGALGGPERYFQGVAIAAEEVKTLETKTTTEEITLEAKGGALPVGLGTSRTITGGNRLIVVALQDDWLRIKDLIAVLDKPQPQVILEVLIIDIRGEKIKSIAGSTRSLTDPCDCDNGLQFLSSNITNVNSVLGVTPQQLASDLLQVVDSRTNTPVTSLLAPGSLLVSFNNPSTPGIWSLLAILDQTVNSKILSHPYLVTTNNQKATITNQELRRRKGDAVPGAAGVVTIQIEDIAATLQVQMIPRLSSLERLSLQVAVDANEFVGTATDTRLTRRVNTNANMASGQVLVIGGLTRKDNTEANTGTPFLSSIPIIGTFFSRKSTDRINTNLAIFICPTIVHPKLRGGMNVYTADKIRKSRRDIDEQMIFNEVRDPITHIFFRSQGGTEKMVRDYLANVSNPPDAELIKTAQEKRREAARVRKKAAPLKKEPAKKGIVGQLPA